jgi:hypothetical protein
VHRILTDIGALIRVWTEGCRNHEDVRDTAMQVDLSELKDDFEGRVF